MSGRRSLPTDPAPADPAARLLRPAEPGRFDPAELDGLAAPIGRWLPFRARQVLDPHRGFVWTARAAGLIAGVDRYLDGAGASCRSSSTAGATPATAASAGTGSGARSPATPASPA